MKQYCIYHRADFDGICSAAIIKYKFPDVELVPKDYGDKLDLDMLANKDSLVVMADISFDKDTMVALDKKCKDFIYIDHHESAIKDIVPLLTKEHVYVDTKFAACELVWKYYFGNPVPDGVDLLGTHDSWRDEDEDKWEERVEPFQYGMRGVEQAYDPTSEIWQWIFDDKQKALQFVRDTILDGDIIMEYDRIRNEHNAEQSAFEVTIPYQDGVKAIVLCSAEKGSALFDAVYDEDEHDVMLVFNYDGKQYNFSIYSTLDRVDCSEIAKSFKGGGHVGAAGMKMDKMPEWLKVTKK